MVALSENHALITACEKNKIRAERLKYNLNKQGANMVNVLVEDARNLNSFLKFDKILLDTPCSGSGTLYFPLEEIESKEKNTFTQELISRSSKIQRELLKKAIQILKIEQEMVYSTCSILEIENEQNILEFLKQGNVEIMPIDTTLWNDIPLLPTSIKGTVGICPSKNYEGFFIAKLKRIK